MKVKYFQDTDGLYIELRSGDIAKQRSGPHAAPWPLQAKPTTSAKSAPLSCPSLRPTTATV